MCWKPKPSPFIPTKKRALLFAINKYGSGNDLRGCINDIEDVEKKLNKEFPGFDIRKYKDGEVTGKKFFDECAASIKVLRPDMRDLLYVHYSGHGTQIPSSLERNGYHEALYLIDGPFIDDQLQTLQSMIPVGCVVVFKFDSCFSGDMLREVGNPVYMKNKFLPIAGVVVRHNMMTKLGMKREYSPRCIVISGCSEDQTSADALINGRYNGAFTYFDNRSYGAYSTYQSEIDQLVPSITEAGYEQVPTLDGDQNIFNMKVFQ